MNQKLITKGCGLYANKCAKRASDYAEMVATALGANRIESAMAYARQAWRYALDAEHWIELGRQHKNLAA